MKERVAADLTERNAKGASESKGPETERALATEERVNLGYLLEYVRKTRDLWDKDNDDTDVTTEATDDVDGISIHHEPRDKETARMKLDSTKERAFSMRTKKMLDVLALATLKSKSNGRNFPRTVEEATKRDDWPLWREAIKAELMSVIKKGTFRDIQSSRRAKGKPLGTKMVLTIKYNADGSVERYKARFVVLGNYQVFGESYDETYAPTASILAVRQLFAYAATTRLTSIRCPNSLFEC